jgi:hypothetical protein
MAVGAGKGADAFALGVALLTKRGAAEAAMCTAERKSAIGAAA